MVGVSLAAAVGPVRDGDGNPIDSLPIERMAIRDSTSIDGLIHMKITSRCEVAQP